MSDVLTTDVVTCWQCGGDGYSCHDCGEDCCCCADPMPNVKCDICNGEGYLEQDTALGKEASDE